MPRLTNIVLILADDLGYSDLGCYGGEIRTPNLDRLGERGVRMAQFYNTARCSPSRASLLTGKHPHQTGIGVLARPDLPNGYPGDLSPDTPTIAELLATAGWRTGLSGKWHLSGDARTPNGSWPTRRGFERFFGTLAGCGSYFAPQTLTRGEDPAGDALDEGFYYTDAISTEASDWIEQLDAAAPADPFFLYVAYTAPHWPLHALDADLDATRERFNAGWDRLREQRLERLVAAGLVAPDTELSDRDPSQPAWTDEPEQRWQLSRMEAYAAQIEAMDRGIGRILDALARTGRIDDTLVVFLADNGGSAEELPIGPMSTFVQKDAAMRTGARDGAALRIGNSADITPGPENTYASYGVPWANLSNTPFRQYKRWVHEGGIATPFIAHWPNGNLAEGAVVRSPHQLVSVVPTLLDAAGLKVAGFDQEGSSLLPALRGEGADEDTLYWEHIGNAAIRRGRWKLVRDYPSRWELYDMDSDRTELHDLAAAHPELVENLSADWQRWADRVGVISWDQMLRDYEDTGRLLTSAEE